MTRFNKQFEVTVALTVDTDAFHANDVVGGLLTFSVPNSGGGGMIRWVRLVDDDNENAAFNLYFFNGAPTSIANDAAFAPVVADLKKLIGKVAIAAADYETLNLNSYILKNEANGNAPNIDFKASDNGNLYAYLVCTATPTYTAATDLTLTIGGWYDGE